MGSSIPPEGAHFSIKEGGEHFSIEGGANIVEPETPETKEQPNISAVAKGVSEVARSLGSQQENSPSNLNKNVTNITKDSTSNKI